jgi:hypothetical protein
MQNYIPFKDFINQLLQKSFFIIHSGEREYLVPSSIINGEKDKFYKLSDVSEALGKSIVHQKEENGTTEYVDMNNLKAMLLNKELNLDQVLADLESSLVGLLFKNLVDTAIALSGNMTESNNENKDNVESSNQENQTQPKDEITEEEVEQALENENKEKVKATTQPQPKKYYNNKKPYNNNKKKYYKGYSKSYNNSYKQSSKSDKT